MSEVESMRNEIRMAIAKRALINDNYVTMKDIIAQLEKQGIINTGDANLATGQVKTQPKGYVYEIKQENGHWEVTYIGTGEMLVLDAVITLSKNTTGITDKVTITMKAIAGSGIASYTLPEGSVESVTSGETEITKTYVVTSNGTYTFTVVNGEGKTVTKSITINNILEETIQISASTTLPTANNVTVTITWPKASNQAVKQIQVGEGIWQTVTGSASQVTVSENCTIKARVKNSITDIITNSLTIDNIDKTKPTITVTADTEIIDWQANKEISDYFTVEANGIADLTSIEYIDTTNGNVKIQNTNTLTIGTHIIQCIATKETGATSKKTITLIVEPNVYGNLYKISDTEYHLIFNGTGNIAQGYSESQLVVRGTNIKNGSGAILDNTSNTYKSNQPWEPYSNNITKVKIEEKIKPRSISCYFLGLLQITEIEGIEYLDTSNTTNMNSAFWMCKNLRNLDVSGFDTSNVVNIRQLFAECNSLTNLDVSGFDTSNVTNMTSLFYGCSNIASLDVSDWNTSKVTDMHCMFYECRNVASLDVSNWNTSKVTDMSAMFLNCEKITNLDLSGFDTSNVTDMYYMFGGCRGITSLDLSSFDTNKVTNMSNMFLDSKKLTTIYVGEKWTTSAVTEGSEMFNYCTNLRGAIAYDSSKIDVTYANWTTGYFTRKV